MLRLILGTLAFIGTRAQTLGYDWNGFSASGLGCGTDSGALNVGLSQSLPPGATGLKVKQISFAIYGTNSLPPFIQLHGSTATPRLSTSSAVACCGSGCDLAVQVAAAGYSWYNSPCGRPSCANANKWYYMDFSGTAVGTTQQSGISEATFYDAGGSQIGANMINLGSGSVFFMSYTVIIPSPTPTPSLTKSPVSPSLTSSETASTSVSTSVTASTSTTRTVTRSESGSRTDSRTTSRSMSASRAPSATVSPSSAESQSVSVSWGSSSSISETTSSSPSVTLEASQSTTVSSTPSSSPSSSLSPITDASSSVSQSTSLSSSGSVSISASNSMTISSIATVSGSGSSTLSQSQSLSLSATLASTLSTSATVSASPSPTTANTASLSGSLTGSLSSSASPSLSTSRSSSSSESMSLSPTPSASISSSIFPTETLSQTSSVTVSSSGSFSSTPQSFQQISNMTMSTTSTPQFMVTAYPTTSPTYSPTQNATLPIVVVDVQGTNMTTTNALIGATLALIIVAVALAAGRYVPAGSLQRLRRMIPQSTIDNFKRDPLGSVTEMVNDPNSILKNIKIPDSVKSIADLVPQELKDKFVPESVQKLIAPSTATVPHVDADTGDEKTESPPTPEIKQSRHAPSPLPVEEVHHVPAPVHITESEKEADKVIGITEDSGIIVDTNKETLIRQPSTILQINTEDLAAVRAFLEARGVENKIIS